MAKGVDVTIEELLHAGRLCTVAMEDRTGSSRVVAVAVRAMRRAIKKLVDDDALWSDVVSHAARRGELVSTNYSALSELVVEVLTEQHAALLVAAGYRTPPPPPAFALTEETRNAVMALSSDGHGAQVEDALGALRSFLQTVEAHLKRGGSGPGGLLRKGRKVCVASALLLVVNHSAIKTGDEFDASFGLSGKDGFQVEITVPLDLDGHSAVKPLALAACADICRDTVQVNDYGERVLESLGAQPIGDLAGVINVPSAGNLDAPSHSFFEADTPINLVGFGEGDHSDEEEIEEEIEETQDMEERER